jgi:hypothetical protein
VKCSVHPEVDMVCDGGRSAHPSNWSCPKCDSTRDPKSLDYNPEPDKFPPQDISIPNMDIQDMSSEEFSALCLHQKLGYLFEQLKWLRTR